MNDKFSKDLYRYYGEKGESFIGRLLRPTELKYIALFRKAENCKFKPLKLYYTIKLKLKSYKTHIQIPARTKIGEGFYIGHSGRVIIHPEAELGKNINVGTGVTIGYENRGVRRGAPKLDGNCWIGTEIMTAYYLWVKVFALVFVPIYNFITRKIFLEKKTP